MKIQYFSLSKYQVKKVFLFYGIIVFQKACGKNEINYIILCGTKTFFFYSKHNVLLSKTCLKWQKNEAEYIANKMNYMRPSESWQKVKSRGWCCGTEVKSVLGIWASHTSMLV